MTPEKATEQMNVKTDRSEIAYIMKEYPRLSETFIMNEISLLEKMGLPIRVFSVKKPSAGLKQHATASRRSAVVYLPSVTSLSGSSLLGWLWVNLPKFIKSHFSLFRNRPQSYLSTWLQVVKMTFRYRSGFFEKPKKAFIKEFLQAGYIAREILESGRIRHLHGHFCHGSTTITMFVSQLTNIPFSFTAHAKDIYLPKLNPGDLLKRKIEKAQFVVTCTGANQDYLSKLCEGNRPIHTIYHGLDPHVFKAIEGSGLSQAIPIILSVGRFVEKKGFVYLVKACKTLKDKGYDFQCRIVGEPDEQTEVIKKMIKDLGLKENMLITDGVTQETLRKIYRECTIFVLPCQIVNNGDRDGIPNVLVEAMAMEIPVISTSISGIPELIEDGVDGLLVPQKDVSALAGALEKYLQNAKLRVKLGQAGRAKVCTLFNSDKTNIALKNLFVSHMERRKMVS